MMAFDYECATMEEILAYGDAVLDRISKRQATSSSLCSKRPASEVHVQRRPETGQRVVRLEHEFSSKRLSPDFTYELKEADDGTVTIIGLASSEAVDRMGDVVVQAGARVKLPVPFLLGHDHGNPIGKVVETRATAAGLWMRASIYKGASPRIDETLGLIKLGLFPGLSIGFRAIRAEPISGKQSGWRFLEWELLEISAVAVAANPDASIASAKRYLAEHQKQLDTASKMLRVIR